MKRYIAYVILGFILFFIIGSLSSCTSGRAVQHNTITPNNQRLNEAEYIKYKQSIRHHE